METINKVRTRHFVQGKNISDVNQHPNLTRYQRLNLTTPEPKKQDN
jgi:hypothetical protein